MPIFNSYSFVNNQFWLCLKIYGILFWKLQTSGKAIMGLVVCMKDARLPFPRHESKVVLGLEKMCCHHAHKEALSSSHVKQLAFL